LKAFYIANRLGNAARLHQADQTGNLQAGKLRRFRWCWTAPRSVLKAQGYA